MKYTVIRKSEVLSSRIVRFGKMDVLVYYVTEDGRNDFVTLPAEDYSDAALDAVIAAKEGTPGPSAGQTREI